MTKLALPVAAFIAAASCAGTALAQTATPASAPRAWTTADPEGQRGPFAFLGNRIGDPITKAFPDPKNQKDQFGIPLCNGVDFIPGFTYCEDQSLRRIVDGIPRLDYHGVEVGFVNLRYLNDRFIGFAMSFDSKNFASLAAVLRQQYGAPFQTEIVPWKERVGFAFDTAIISWNTPHGVMTLKERAVAVDAGLFELFEAAAERRYHEVRYRQVVD